MTDIATIHTALVSAQGNRAAAAKLLSMAEPELRAAIRGSRELTALWTEPVETSAAAAHDRMPGGLPRVPVALDDPVDLGPPAATEVVDPVDPKAMAIEAQERKLQRLDWEGLGVTNPDSLKLMRQFEGFVGGGVHRTMDTIYGGLNFAFAHVSARFAEAAEKLASEEVQNNDAKRIYWHSLFMDYAREMRGFHKDVVAAAQVRLQIHDRAKKMQKAAEGVQRQAGWGKTPKNATPAKGGGNAKP